MKRVACMGGSGYVRGTAKQWTYHVACLFEFARLKNGRFAWKNTGIHTRPRRSVRLCEEDAEQLAELYDCEVESSYGSLHNHECNLPNSLHLEELVKEMEEIK